MNRVFSIPTPFRVPDGTLVSPFLNSKDTESGLPFDLLDGASIAAGLIEPRTESTLHIMPFVTQVTFVRQGKLEVMMKSATDDEPYELSLQSDEAVITLPGTLFQLVNRSGEPCHVLYIVSPAYVFEMSNGQVIYDDAIMLRESWADLKKQAWEPSAKLPTHSVRDDAWRRLQAREHAQHGNT